MPKKKSKSKTLSPFNRDLLNDPMTMQIMKEMDVKPLKGSSNMSEFNLDNENRKRPLQDANGNTYGFQSPSKVIKSDYILLRKSNWLHVEEQDYFSKLSDEIILQIFDFLPKPVLVKCSEVCKRWRRLSYDESFWKRYDFGRSLVKPGAVETLLSRGVTMLRLAMSDIKTPIFIDSEFIGASRFSKLQYLDLSMANISVDDLSNLLSVCNLLKKLSLEYCELNEKCLKSIAQNKNLEVLNLAMCQGLTADGLHAIGVNCLKLQELNIAWCHLDKLCMEVFLPVLPESIRRLNISGHRDTFDDEALIKVVHRCPYLLELDMSDSPSITEDSFTVLIDGLSHLVHLHMSRSYNIPTICNQLLKTMKSLKYIEIFRTLTDDSLETLRKYLPNIKINTTPFSTIARPTTGIRRTSIWGLRVRD